MSDETSKETTAEERKFLHDIANNIVVAHGMTTFVLRTLRDNPNVDAREIERLEKALTAINKMTESIQERRAVLHANS